MKMQETGREGVRSSEGLARTNRSRRFDMASVIRSAELVNPKSRAWSASDRL